jgi:hypothetical protein
LVGSAREVRARPRPVDPDFPFPFRRDELDEEGPIIPAGVLYWMLVSFLTGAVAVYYYVSQGAKDPQDLLYGLLIAVLVLPGLQLGASALAVLAIGVFYADRATALRRVVQITLWSFVGTMVGIALMGGFCGVVSLVGR